jgi:hypothetical protein
MKNLKILWANGDSGVTDDDIKELNLVELNSSGNSKIKK